MEVLVEHLTIFRQIANTFDCHVLLIHHNGKNTEFSGEQALLGSTGISASVDTVLLMKRRTGGADSTMIYSDRLRYGRKLEEQELYLDPESGQLTMGTSGAELQQHACEFDIIALLEESARPIGLHEIRKALGIKTETVSLALRKLVDKGQLSILGEGTRGKPKLYSLPSPTT